MGAIEQGRCQKMADAVERLMEDMLPELEDLVKRELFTNDEIRSTIQKRRNFEYTLKRRQLERVDYLRYIQFEIRFDLLRRKRKKRMNTGKITVSDHAGARRIHGLYNRALRRFKSDVTLWAQYINFCKSSGAQRQLGRVYASALQANPLCISLWMRRGGEDDDAKVEEAVKQAMDAIKSASKENAIKILQILLHVMIVAGQEASQITPSVERFISNLTEDMDWLKLAYLQWAMSSLPMDQARSTYSNILRNSKSSVAVYGMCISYEKSLNSSVATVTKLYEQAVTLHGKSSANLWLAYISDKQRAGDVQEVGKLYFRANKMLEDPSDVAKVSQHI